MGKLKTAVIGVGYLGKFHADKYAALKNSKLVAVVDANMETAQAVADKHGVQGADGLPRAAGQGGCGQYRGTDHAASPDCARFSRTRLPRVNREADYGHRG